MDLIQFLINLCSTSSVAAVVITNSKHNLHCLQLVTIVVGISVSQRNHACLKLNDKSLCSNMNQEQNFTGIKNLIFKSQHSI